jgi:hypothetical protein
MVKKIFEMEVEGAKRGFRFGMWTNGKACELEKCTIDELFERLGITGGSPSIMTLTNWFFAAAICYANGNKSEVDFTSQDVSDWIDFYGLEKSMKMMTEAFSTPDIKNNEAPMTSAGQ